MCMYNDGEEAIIAFLVRSISIHSSDYFKTNTLYFSDTNIRYIAFHVGDVCCSHINRLNYFFRPTTLTKYYNVEFSLRINNHKSVK